MPLLTLESVSLAYGHVALLDRVDLALDGGDKVALIGRNGTGKSSLLRIVAGTASPDDGVVWRTPGLRLAHVPQEPQFAPGQSVFEAAAEGLGDMRRLLGEYERVAHALEGGRDDALLARLEELSAQLESGEGWRLKSRVETVLSRLHLPAHALVEALSGGQKKRAALARALVVEPELMLLDEPTNHLDIESIQWLEELLVSFAGALLFVTHDRTFLDRVATRVIELDRGRLSSFPGSYSAFRQRKSEQLAQEATVNDKFDKLLAQEEAWIRRGVEARRTREQWRIRRLEELRRQRGERRERLGSVSLAVEEGVRSGQLVAELSHVSKSFAGAAERGAGAPLGGDATAEARTALDARSDTSAALGREGAAERGAGAPLGGDATAEARTALDARSDTSAALGREGAAERGAGAPLGGDATAEARTALDARSDTSAALGREGAAERGAGAPLGGDATAEARTALDARSDTSAALGREGAAERGAGAPLVGDATAEARTALDARSDTSAALGREGAAERAALDAGSDTPIPFVGEGKPVVEDFTCRILRGDKVGLIGPNGAGKTTLLRLILGDLQPDAGTVRRGTRLSAAYYDQFRTQLDEEASVLDTVGQGSDYVEVAGERKHVMSYLGDFLFSPERVRSPVKSLSGGERNRLLLARLFTRSSNLLVLDEPTNDLDIETLELLEALLQDYSGTVLLVSHDRAFLDNVVTQVIAFDGDGRWLENPGGYQEWARVLRAREEGGRASGSEAQPASRAQSIRTARAPKLSWKEQQELKELPARIEGLEREQGELARQLADPAFYGSAPAQAVRDANSRFQELEALLLAALERWTELEAKGK